jgi:N-acetylneuraminic acid mutarotase
LHLKWRFGPEYPSYVKGGAMARVGDAVLYAGGMTQPWRENETAWYLRPENKDWRQAAAFPGGPCVAAMVAALGGKIYHFGGYDLWYEQGQRHIEVKNTAWIYDVAANRWEPLPALPRRMYGGARTVLRDRYIVLMGGVVYDTANRSYEWSRTPMPRGHNDIRAAVLDEKIYVVGGENADVTLSNTTSDVVIAEIE